MRLAFTSCPMPSRVFGALSSGTSEHLQNLQPQDRRKKFRRRPGNRHSSLPRNVKGLEVIPIFSAELKVVLPPTIPC